MSLVRSALILTVVSAARLAEIPVEGTSGQWVIESADRALDAKIAPYLGRDALWLRNNTQVLRDGLELIDGEIELDLAPMPGCDFFALVFRRESLENHENIYFRPFQTGRFHAVQYAPRLRGSSSWQLYPQFNAKAELPEAQWAHIRVTIQGPRMKLFLGDAKEPVIAVERLLSESKGAALGVWARQNIEPETWAAVVEEWIAVEAEESGLLNLSRALGRFPEPRTAVARTTIEAEEAKTATLSVGYSDAVTVFLNGQPIYSAVNGWESRYPGYLGYVETGHEFVHLPLVRGSNELVFIVTDDQRFGWGFAARLER